MLDSCIYNLLDHILPSTDKSKHDILRLEYLSSCKLMENGNYTIQILPQTPAYFYEPLLKSVIYKYYLDYIKLDDYTIDNIYESLNASDLAFPGFLNSIRLLILNWPGEELIVRNQIPPLDTPVERFLSEDDQLTSRKAICPVRDMAKVFHKFCHIVIHFVTNVVFKHGYSCNLKRIDVSGFNGNEGLGNFTSREYSREYVDHTRSFFRLDDILEGIRNSNIDTYGHKMDFFADAEFTLGDHKDFELFSMIIKESSNMDVGIAVYFKTIEVNSLLSHSKALIPSDFYTVLALARCEYIHLDGDDFDRTGCVKKLSVYLPKLVGLNLKFTDDITNLHFLSAFEHLEQLSIGDICKWRALTNYLSNMSKGLKYLDLSGCSLHNENLTCLAKSVHANTLIELNINNNFENASVPVGGGLVILCQKLENIKVLHVDFRLDKLSSNSSSNLVNAFNNCNQLEFLSMNGNRFSLEITNVIIDGLAQNNSLRYLSLDFPTNGSNEGMWENFSIEDNIEDEETMHNFSEKFHEQINKLRDSSIYISWNYYWQT